jgi:hypothetical protein
MKRFVFRASLLVVLGAATALSCRAPIRGVDYGAESDPFRHERIVDPVEVGGELVHRLVLIGDAGAPLPEDPTLALLGTWGDTHPDRTTVLFLGDNVYPAGLQEADREGGERVLQQQIEATRAPKIFVPGNHDWGFQWNRSFTEGVLANAQAYLDEHAASDARLEPRDGCPGPVAVELVAPATRLPGGLTLLLLDLHWWLLPEAARPVCEGIDGTTAFVERLREELVARADENVVVAAHHPIRSGGEHGGFTRGFWFDLGVAIFYRLYTVQDLVEPSYREMIGVLSEVLSENPPVAMVGGHDHSLQILEGGDEARLVVVSGAATKVSRVTSIDGTLFAHARRGFIVFDFYDTGPGSEGTLLVQVAETGHGDRPVAAIGLDLGREEEEPQVVPAPRRQGSLLRPQH